ncbi:MAG: sensor histidine kinase [Promethearchaeota archaeon]
MSDALIAAIDLVSLFIMSFALVLLYHHRSRILREIWFVLLFLFILGIFNFISNVLEWSGIISFLDYYEDYFEILQMGFWGILFFTYFQLQSRQKILKAQLDYKKALRNSEFYKDLLSHDFRNILQGILSALYLIESIKDQEARGDTFKELIARLRDHVWRGKELINTIKKISKIQDEVANLFEVDLLLMLQESITEIKEKHFDKKMQIQIKVDEGIFQDRKIRVKANGLLKEVFINLLDNSIKHNNNEKILVDVEISRENRVKGHFIKMAFIDNGPGINISLRKRIFDRTKSRGLGLILVKTIVEKLGGEIWFEDKKQGSPSKGVKVVLIIPEVKNADVT